MSWLLVTVLLALFAVGVWWVLQRDPPPPPAKEPPSRAWASETVTPVMMGPRNKAPERVSRQFVVDQGALLAMYMAQVDGTIVEAERDVVLAFIQQEARLPAGDSAQRLLALAEGALDNPVRVANAIEGLRALSSEEQKHALVQLLVAVAQADGAVVDSEVRFMERVGAELGLTPRAVQARIALPG